MKKNISIYDLSKKDLISAWTKSPFPLEIQEEAKIALNELENSQTSSLLEAFTIPLEFGTGGIRGKIGNGIGKMNLYTIGRAALGYSRFLVSKYKSPSIVIAYDSRRMSIEFAEATAIVASSLGIKVKLFPNVAPTPILSFAIRELKAKGGVVITASHNPPEYNGFKAYLEDGGQLVAPFDSKIIEEINSIIDWNELPEFKKGDTYKKLVSKVDKTLFESYKKKVISSPIYNKKLSSSDRNRVSIVYSPLHGTGGVYMKGLLNTAGYKKVFLVPEQEKPNGEFPTVKSPNPEEREALVLSEKTSKEKKANIFLASDPDADRLGVGVLDSAGNYVLLNGNQIGSILCAYLSEKVTEKGKPKFDYQIFKTIVTTDLQENIAKKNKLKIKNVLTGFKFIGSEMTKLEKDKKKKFLFGGEESYGYLPVEIMRDKDSLSSALLLLEVLTDKKDLLAYLDEIYLKYGLFLESLKSINLEGEAGKSKIKASLESLRTKDLVGLEIAGRKVVGVLDFKNKKATGIAKSSAFSGLPSSDVIQLLLSPNAKLTIRPSGTEPKVKLYSSFESRVSPKNRIEISELKDSLNAEIKLAENEFTKLAGLE
ncbi:MAG: phospho-sugar mutase [Leptospiraceae bacterium]|nr:phospho-sugar mutase [Leptospiraceae bacterium]